MFEPANLKESDMLLGMGSFYIKKTTYNNFHIFNHNGTLSFYINVKENHSNKKFFLNNFKG